MSRRFTNWRGKSGKFYRYWLCDLDIQLKESPGNYIYAKEIRPGYFIPIYIGETDSLSEGLDHHEKMASISKGGATHIFAHKGSPDDVVRQAEEQDLIEWWSPPCNG